MSHSVYKRASRKYYSVSWMHEGRRVTRSTGCTTRRDAHKAALEIIRSVTVDDEPVRQDLDQWIETYLSYLGDSGRSRGYVREVGQKLSALLTGIPYTTDLTSVRMQRVADTLPSSGKSVQTQAHYIQTLKTFLRWLADRGVTPSDTGSKLKKPRLRDADKARPRGCLSVSEFNSLIETTATSAHVRFRMNGTRRALLYRLAAGTGLRLSEISCLHTDSIVMRSHSLFLSLSGTRTKNGTHLLQPISGTLGAELKALPVGPIFPRLNKGSAFMKADLEDASIPYVDSLDQRRDFHSLRAYYITRLIENGVPIHVVQRLARHASPVTTMKHYAKVDPGTDFMNVLGDAGL